MKKNLFYLTIIIFLFLIFKNYTIVLSSTINAVEIWLYKVFPYLFIMIIINDLLIGSNIVSKFKNPSHYIFIMSLLSGTPSSAYITQKMVENKEISKTYANNTLLFTYFSNPLFLFAILKSIFPSSYIWLKLIIIHYMSNIIIYLFYKNKLKEKFTPNNHFEVNLTGSIKSSITTTTMVLGAITFYLITSNILLNTFLLPPYMAIILRGLLELTQGLNALINTNILGKELLAIIFISFGGLSIHTQVKCILDEAKLDYKYFFKGRIIQTIIASILTIIS